MSKKLSALVSSGIMIVGFANPAWAGCVTAKGKIANNAQAGNSTLGVAALELGAVKIKCAVSGVPQLPSPTGPNYQHTLVCDDHVGTGLPQSQISLNTYFVSPPVATGYCSEGNPFGPVSFTFEERSIPIQGSGRGLFSNASPVTSAITITGDFNCNGGINMKFQGQICFPD